jgi:hypothetical protein
VIDRVDQISPLTLLRWDDRDTLVSIFQKTTKSNDVELLKKHTLKLQILHGGFREVSSISVVLYKGHRPNPLS